MDHRQLVRQVHWTRQGGEGAGGLVGAPSWNERFQRLSEEEYVRIKESGY